MFFGPLAFIFILLFFFYIVFFFFMVQINLIALAFTKIGIPSEYVFTALFFSLVGSFINIPIKKIPQHTMTDETMVRFFGSRYRIPNWQKMETVLAVNVGGAVIPVLISIYLLFKTGLWGRAAIATAIITMVTYRFAKPIKGVGIALPAFLPPVLAALISVFVAYHGAPVVAYISGTIGTLIGADILNLRKIGNLGAPLVSIGGAGTFDGIFLNGIIAVLLAVFLSA
ncbi:MAG TPA: DUF1614 domain-containing protein [Desulfobacteraceae bacterium]|nr:MAG: hypothetical protein B1H13_07055 [Desulfobacteraceae bacterium 4484_190.3]RLB19690.1 MAG: hypothetical protein DRG82_00585 [Deltaproteobacteria bacterium]HDZ23942.1 DUF1614 domain-containing protein [Desulfobacteraceae bacterium]